MSHIPGSNRLGFILRPNLTAQKRKIWALYPLQCALIFYEIDLEGLPLKTKFSGVKNVKSGSELQTNSEFKWPKVFLSLNGPLLILLFKLQTKKVQYSDTIQITDKFGCPVAISTGHLNNGPFQLWTTLNCSVI